MRGGWGQEEKGTTEDEMPGWHHLNIQGRTDAEAETPKLWPPDVKNRLVGKDPDEGKD